jgi:hypothetical protein
LLEDPITTDAAEYVRVHHQRWQECGQLSRPNIDDSRVEVEAIMKGRKRIRPADDSRLQKEVVIKIYKPRNPGWQKRYLVG